MNFIYTIKLFQFHRMHNVSVSKVWPTVHKNVAFDAEKCDFCWSIGKMLYLCIVKSRKRDEKKDIPDGPGEHDDDAVGLSKG